MMQDNIHMLNSICDKIVERDYVSLITLVNRFIECFSWCSLTDHLRFRLEENPSSGMTRGMVRDAIVELLHLHLLQGLDGDLTILFDDLSSQTVDDLQQEALPVAVRTMRDQIRKGNTFFLDVTKMADIPILAVLIPKIFEVRERQILRLEDSPPLTDVYSTYYGFMILTQGSIGTDESGAAGKAVDGFTDLAIQFGKNLAINPRQLKYSKTAFGRVSGDMRDLLWNMLCASAAGRNRRKQSIKYLGSLRDSRALQVLHPLLLNTSNEKVKRHILEAVGSIRHASSYEVIQKDISKDWRTRSMQQEVAHTLLHPYMQRIPSHSKQ